MAHRRPSLSKLEALDEKVARIRKKLHYAQIIAQGKDSEFWKTIREIVKGKMESVGRRLAEPMSLTADERLGFLQQQVDLEYFLDMPDDLSDSLSELEKSLQEALAEKDFYADKIENHS